MKKLILGILLIFNWQYGTSQIDLVEDLNPGPNLGLGATAFIVYNGELYFPGQNASTGMELWKYDGTTVSLVADIYAGNSGSAPSSFAVYNNKLYFEANDGIHGPELWVYDGTTASLVADNQPGPTGGFAEGITEYNGKLYFTSRTANNDFELYSYDGTNISLAADIRSGIFGSLPSKFRVHNGELYFEANDNISGNELWKYDGTTASLVSDIRAGASAANVSYLTTYNGDLYFRADDGISGYELWKYDGTSTSLVSDIGTGANGSNVRELYVYNGDLYFSANNGTTGDELWKYDGTSASLVSDINMGTSNSDPAHFGEYNGDLYFKANNGSTGEELFKYDGTTVSLVEEIRLGSSGSTIRALMVYNNILYFMGRDDDAGQELRRYVEPAIPVHVDLNATGNNDGSDWANAYTNLQDALDVVPQNGRIWIAEGTYLPSKNAVGTTSINRDATFYLEKNITIEGGYPTGGGTPNPLAHQTILSGDLGSVVVNSDNAYHVLTLVNMGSFARFSGLVIQDGNANAAAYPNDRGAGVYNDGSNARKSNPLFKNCVFRWNNASNMGGAMLNFANNNGETSPKLYGCLFYENTALDGASIANSTYLGGTNKANLINCTFADNTGGASIHNKHGNANIRIRNSILWDNEPLYNLGVETTVQYSLVKKTSLATGTINAGFNILNLDPQFTDAANDDYSLVAASAGVDKANTDIVPGILSTDLNGAVREMGAKTDLGALENTVVSTRPTLIYVNTNATGANDGTSWANAFTTLSAAVDIAVMGDVIWAAGGTYYPTIGTDRTASFNIRPNVKVYGGFVGTETMLNERDWAANPTILSGDIGTAMDNSDNSYHVVYLYNTNYEDLSNEGVSFHNARSVVLDGLTVQDGNANGATYPNERGGGIFNDGANWGTSDPILVNCVFRWNNATTLGGAILNIANNNGRTSPDLYGCLFYENTSPEGASIANTTLNSGINTMRITNCTFADNSGGSSIVNKHGNADISIQNSILWDNIPLQNYGMETTIEYSLIKLNTLPTGTNDEGDIIYNKDPLFADAANDDYRLTLYSRAVDEARGTFVPFDFAKDLAGNDRENGDDPDMGAFENLTGHNSTLYVNLNATGTNSGLSWTDAFTNLEDALALAINQDEIWVATGTYRPTTTTDRTKSFLIQSDDQIKIYGGFNGTETSKNQRNWAANPTILSGDIGTAMDNSDNSYHVFYVMPNARLRLYGVAVQDGNANGVYPHDRGAGVYVDGKNYASTDLSLYHTILRWNMASFGGGAILLEANNNGETEFSMYESLLYENTAPNGASIANTTFNGGYNYSEIYGCTFADNIGNSSIHNRHGNGEVYLGNNILWDDNPISNVGTESYLEFNLIKAATMPAGSDDDGDNIFNMDPLFTDAANDDYTLQNSSPAIAAGDEDYSEYSEDLSYNTRIVGATVDLGCYENQNSLARPALAQNDDATDVNTGSEEQSLTAIEKEMDASLLEAARAATMTIYPNPVQDMVNINMKDVNQQATVRLLSTTGQVLIEEQVQADAQTVLQLNMGRLAKGMYLLNVQLEDGTQLNERVVKF